MHEEIYSEEKFNHVIVSLIDTTQVCTILLVISVDNIFVDSVCKVNVPVSICQHFMLCLFYLMNLCLPCSRHGLCLYPPPKNGGGYKQTRWWPIVEIGMNNI